MKGLWLIGFRGAGKTTLGRKLALQLGWEFLDLDEEWEQRQKTTILRFVELQGVEAFREEEHSLLAEAASQMKQSLGLIVATGGGVVDWPPSRKVLEEDPHPKAFLNPSAEVLWDRLKSDEERLKIGQLSNYENMHALLEKRRPFYMKISTAVCENRDISESLPLLVSLLEKT